MRPLLAFNDYFFKKSKNSGYFYKYRRLNTINVLGIRKMISIGKSLLNRLSFWIRRTVITQLKVDVIPREFQAKKVLWSLWGSQGFLWKGLMITSACGNLKQLRVWDINVFWKQLQNLSTVSGTLILDQGPGLVKDQRRHS